MANFVNNKIKIENARIGFRNFGGKESQFNLAGRRNFCVFLEDELAQTLQEDGWNVRWLQPRDDQEKEQGYLQVEVSYKNIPPTITMISSSGRTLLDETSVSVLDWAEIEEIDLVIRPYNWEMHVGTKNEKRGVKAYIEKMYVKIVEDEFEKKWANSPTGSYEED